MVPPYRTIQQAQQNNKIVEIALQDWNGEEAKWRLRVEALEGNEEEWRAKGELLSSTTLGDAPEWFTQEGVLYIQEIEDDAEESDPLKPEIDTEALLMPERVEVSYAEVKISGEPRGIPAGDTYYSPFGGVISHDGEWLSVEGAFSGKEIGAVMARLSEVMVDPAELRVAPVTSAASLPMRFTVGPEGIFLGDDQKVTPDGARDDLPNA